MTSEGALSKLKPRTTAGLVRQLMPEIDRKAREGVSLDAICEALSHDGIDIKENTLKVYLYRYRKAASSGLSKSPVAAPKTETETVRHAQAERIEHKDIENAKPESDTGQKIETPPSIDDLLKRAGSETGDFTDQFMPAKPRLLKTKRNPK